jgi:EAL domain-containing protein (putative c-di-GMP-specific phosphodiesterase class I)
VVSDALAIHCVEPSRLCLEVTESVMVENPAVVLNQLAKLQATGVRIALDDFGTGYCSLSYFRDLPVDEIKIDKSFVLNMVASEKDYAIVKAVIDLAHNFSMKVVAEGVETNEIASELAKLGCDVLQGYVFDRPLPSDEFSAQYGLQAGSGRPSSHN